MWNATMYNCYGQERMQPSIDLVNQIREKNFETILDVGCGTGMSTATIAAVWKNADITGVDFSSEMLVEAQKLLPEVSFIQRDCRESIADLGSFDLIFSNAFLQWLPQQEEFMQQSFVMLTKGGVFAVQIPLFNEMPANQCIKEAEALFPKQLANLAAENYLVHSGSEYYNMLAKLTGNISMWVTEYYHEMASHEQVLDFLKGAPLRAQLDRLDEQEQTQFLQEISKNLRQAYPCQENGQVLFPFRRLFLVGVK